MAPDVLADHVAEGGPSIRLADNLYRAAGKFELMGGRLQHHGGNFKKFFLRLPRGKNRRVAGDDGDARGERADAKRRAVGIGRDYMDMRQRNVQLVRDDLAQHRHGALTHVAFAAVDDHAAVFLDLDHDCGAIPVADGTVAADVHDSRHAHAAPLDAGTEGFIPLVLPSDGHRRAVNALFQAGAADLPTVHGYLACRDRVALVDIDRVDAEHAAHRVQVAVQRELHLRAAETAKRAMRRIVRIDQRGMRTHIFQAVHVVAAHGADMHDLGRQAAVGAAFGDDPHVLGDDQAVSCHADP